jgi:beta-lactamase superfamily II metal-dependent hydrolase
MENNASFVVLASASNCLTLILELPSKIVINLHVVQAEFGDCFILEYRSGNESCTIIIDGGPYQTFENHLKPTVQQLLSNRKIDLMILSHVDNDHIIGLLDLLVEIKNQRESGTKELFKISKMWHNSFKNLLLLPDEPKQLLAKLSQDQSLIERRNILESLIMKGYQQGTDLTKLAKSLKIPINQGFGEVIEVEHDVKSARLNNINLRILGPTMKNLEKLRKEWNEWLTKKQQTEITESGLIQILDKSVPNLASIMFLAEIKNRKILFAGDGLGQDIVDILSKNAMLDQSGKFYVDVLKVPHHGSDRNTSLEFFNTVNAKYYIISANGRDDNPSLNTLKWIIESESTGKSSKKIILTNMTPNVKKILQKYDHNDFNYEIVILEKSSNFLTLSL